MVRSNSYQKSVALSSSNQIIGVAYENINQFKSYLSLGAVNDSLARENANLKEQLKTAFYNDSIEQKTVVDTTLKQQYTYIVAQVVNNSIHQKDNTITINRGRRHGITKGMGVLSPSGVVGIVRDVSAHYATIQSILHTDTRISASIAESNSFGSLVWGEDNFDPQIATLRDIPNHVIIKRGQRVVTSGFSLFPPGIPIGKIIITGAKGGESFLDIKVKLATDFSTLRHVYVVKNHFAMEQQQLEAQSKKDE